MKKVISLLLVVMLFCTFTLPVFAADLENNDVYIVVKAASTSHATYGSYTKSFTNSDINPSVTKTLCYAGVSKTGANITMYVDGLPEKTGKSAVSKSYSDPAKRTVVAVASATGSSTGYITVSC